MNEICHHCQKHGDVNALGAISVVEGRGGTLDQPRAQLTVFFCAVCTKSNTTIDLILRRKNALDEFDISYYSLSHVAPLEGTLDPHEPEPEPLAVDLLQLRTP